MLTEAVPGRGRTGAKKKNKKPADALRVLKNLEQHILLDGFRIVIDLEKSRGSYLYDAASGRRLIDLYGGKEPRLIFVRRGQRTPVDRSLRLFRLDAGWVQPSTLR